MDTLIINNNNNYHRVPTITQLAIANINHTEHTDDNDNHNHGIDSHKTTILRQCDANDTWSKQ